jgi:hypothetical protein
VRQNGIEGDNDLKSGLAAERVFTKEIEKNTTKGGPDNTRVKSKSNGRLQQTANAQTGNSSGPRRNGWLKFQKSLVVRQKFLDTWIVRIIPGSKSFS